MSSFKRQIARSKTTTFSKKEVEKVNKEGFKENFGIKWIPMKWQSLAIVLLDIFFVNLAVTPLVQDSFGDIAYVLVNAIFTSILIVISFHLTAEKDDQPSLKSNAIRFLFLAIIFGVIATIQVVI